MLSNALVRLSLSRFIQKRLAIKSRSRRKLNICKVFGPQFFSGWTTPTFLLHILARFTVHRLQVCMVEFLLLTSVCEAWQWSRKQNLRRMGKNAGPILSRLWTKVHNIVRRCKRPLRRLPIVYVTFLPRDRRYWPKVAIELRSRRKKVVFGPQIFGVCCQKTVSYVHVTPFTLKETCLCILSKH